MRRFVGLITSFPVGDWIFEDPLITLLPSGNGVFTLKGICTGDVNGTNNP
ncbi:MAG: hypothetical protein NTU44_10860 [Bacteroidetes bacterium]|nr:hypothetical protein [Bacteroidota bacterium]